MVPHYLALYQLTRDRGLELEASVRARRLAKQRRDIRRGSSVQAARQRSPGTAVLPARG